MTINFNSGGLAPASTFFGYALVRILNGSDWCAVGRGGRAIPPQCDVTTIQIQEKPSALVTVHGEFANNRSVSVNVRFNDSFKLAETGVHYISIQCN